MAIPLFKTTQELEMPRIAKVVGAGATVRIAECQHDHGQMMILRCIGTRVQ
jgi:hypothetical protein